MDRSCDQKEFHAAGNQLRENPTLQQIQLAEIGEFDDWLREKVILENLLKEKNLKKKRMDFKRLCSSRRKLSNILGTLWLPATASNIECANMLSKAFGGVPVEFVVNRRFHLCRSKRSNTSAEIRQNKDAPRIMHYSTLSIEPSLMNCVKNKKILLYDDVITWGNVSEAARNLLLRSD
jgi:hypothetical protein